LWLDLARNRFEDELSSAPLVRLESAARVRGGRVDDLLSIALAAAS
jgi:hypothetical protein